MENLLRTYMYLANNETKYEHPSLSLYPLFKIN